MNYPLDLPTSIAPDNITFYADNVTISSSSPFTYQEQILAYPGKRWRADVSIPPCKADLAEPWVAFLLGLNGQEGTFLLGDPLNTSLRGVATRVIKKNFQTGSNIDCNITPDPFADGVVLGDWLQRGTGLDSRLHKIVGIEQTTASSGFLDIWPPILDSTASEDFIISDTTGLFRLTSNAQPWSINNANSYGIQFSCVSVV